MDAKVAHDAYIDVEKLMAAYGRLCTQENTNKEGLVTIHQLESIKPRPATKDVLVYILTGLWPDVSLLPYQLMEDLGDNYYLRRA